MCEIFEYLFDCNIENNIIRIRDLIIRYDNKINLLNTRSNKVNYNEVPYISTYTLQFLISSS